MSDDLGAAIKGLAETLHTGTAPGKPPQPFTPRFMTGTLSAISSTKCSVTFPANPAGASGQLVVIPNLSFLLTGRTLVVGDIVLVLQMPHQRIVLAAISH